MNLGDMLTGFMVLIMLIGLVAAAVWVVAEIRGTTQALTSAIKELKKTVESLRLDITRHHERLDVADLDEREEPGGEDQRQRGGRHVATADERNQDRDRGRPERDRPEGHGQPAGQVGERHPHPGEPGGVAYAVVGCVVDALVKERLAVAKAQLGVPVGVHVLEAPHVEGQGELEQADHPEHAERDDRGEPPPAPFAGGDAAPSDEGRCRGHALHADTLATREAMPRSYAVGRSRQ
jgi:hypothetical protein